MQKEEKRENERAILRKASCYGIERETRDIQFLSFFSPGIINHWSLYNGNALTTVWQHTNVSHFVSECFCTRRTEPRRNLEAALLYKLSRAQLSHSCRLFLSIIVWEDRLDDVSKSFVLNIFKQYCWIIDDDK